MIITKNLTKQFDEFIAVDGVSLEVPAGQVLALLGPNGAGKTTTVRMLTSVLRPTRGQASVVGYDVVRNPAQVRAHVGVLTEQHGLYMRMPGDEYLDFFGQVYGMSKTQRTERIHHLLGKFGLGEVSSKRVGEYSKGMRQKLALARALLHDPPALLLDEPTSAMDPESARLVRDSIKALRSAERAIIICTHNLAEAEELADQIAIIRRGRIIALGSPTELKRQLLGPMEFEVRLANSLNGAVDVLPDGATYITSGENWLRYSTESPSGVNPKVLQALISSNLSVVSLHEVPRTLEQVYMQAVNAASQEEQPHVV